MGKRRGMKTVGGKGSNGWVSEQHQLKYVKAMIIDSLHNQLTVVILSSACRMMYWPFRVMQRIEARLSLRLYQA
jgi:hypothetical protein